MTTRRQPMTPRRQRMWEDLQLRNYSEHTMRAYLHCVADFAKHFGTSPEHLGPEQVRLYQLFLIQEQQRAWPTVVQAVCALRFFYRVTLKRPGMMESIAYPHRPLTLPTILRQAAVAAVLTALPNLKHRAICTTLSAAGLRVAELCQLRVTASDSAHGPPGAARQGPAGSLCHALADIAPLVTTVLAAGQTAAVALSRPSPRAPDDHQGRVSGLPAGRGGGEPSEGDPSACAAVRLDIMLHLMDTHGFSRACRMERC